VGDLPAFASAAELLDRLRQRDKPGQGPSLTPHALEFSGLRADLATSNEKRIAKLRHALANAHAKLEHEFSFVRLRGHAAIDFNKER